MTPECRNNLVNEWKTLNAKLKDVEPHSDEERILLARQNEIARQIGEDLSRQLVPRTGSQ